MKSVLATVAFTIALPFSFAACVVVDTQGHIARDEKRFTVSGTPEVHLTTFDGSITIRAGETKTIVVEIEKRGPSQEAVDQLKIETSQDGNRVEIEVKKPARDVVFFGVGHMSPTASLIVTMPAQGNVFAKSGDGAIRIEHVHGQLELRTGDGSVRGTDIGGKLTIATGDGSVTLDDVDGDVDVDTGDGGVSVAGRIAIAKVHTGDGSITFRAAPGTAMKDDWSIVTGDGGVSLFLPSDFAADLDAHTGDGSIRNELSVAAEKDEDRDRERRTLKGKIGAGGKTLRIRTGDGSIRLKTS
jgi:DUF4097 and DUF4098 domain-containing protein YvlB